MNKIKKTSKYILLIAIFILIIAMVFAAKVKKDHEKLLPTPADENGIFSAGDHYFKVMEAYEEQYIYGMVDKINYIKENLLKENIKAYYGIIPDKTYFVENDYFAKENYDKIVSILNREIKDVEYIDVFNTLALKDYFRTDHHWKQEKIIKVANKLGEKMGFSVKERDYKKKVYKEFKGVYSEYINEHISEELTYLTNDILDNVIVEAYDKEAKFGIYDEKALETNIPYNIFISETWPITTIINSKADNEKSLIIFGDSFSNSLIPLLVKSYSKITFIDLRLVASFYLPELMDFNEEDVLFLYNTSIINRSAMLK